MELACQVVTHLLLTGSRVKQLQCLSASYLSKKSQHCLQPLPSSCQLSVIALSHTHALLHLRSHCPRRSLVLCFQPCLCRAAWTSSWRLVQKLECDSLIPRQQTHTPWFEHLGPSAISFQLAFHTAPTLHSFKALEAVLSGLVTLKNYLLLYTR